MANPHYGAGVLGVTANHGYAAMPETSPPTPRTITSAISRMETLNERLGGLRVGMEKLADQIGGPRPAAEKQQPSAQDPTVVGRLNDSAEYAHVQLNEIEGLMNGIARALG